MLYTIFVMAAFPHKQLPSITCTDGIRNGPQVLLRIIHGTKKL